MRRVGNGDVDQVPVLVDCIAALCALFHFNCSLPLPPLLLLFDCCSLSLLISSALKGPSMHYCDAQSRYRIVIRHLTPAAAWADEWEKIASLSVPQFTGVAARGATVNASCRLVRVRCGRANTPRSHQWKGKRE
ncbi:hypothetical protein TRVL_07633 [Trypanosoma vivax]|nr:hypothetical protein TRVL_07633 [Trypanosoma vivax]